MVALSLMFATLLGAAAPTKLATAVETDPRLQSNGPGWRLDQATIVDTRLPRVLLIGDSILNGYRAHVIAALKGRAYVDAWVNPHHQSDHVNKLLAEVLAHGPYDVVHFNLGLHGWPKGRIKDGTFKPLTRAYVQVIREKLPRAALIWASSTPTTVKGDRSQMNPNINPIIIEHNRMAAEVMNDLKVPTNDLYALLMPKLSLIGADGVHWQRDGYKVMAEVISESILTLLPSTPVRRAF
jgi:lysophospholipase L1-like esterase